METLIKYMEYQQKSCNIRSVSFISVVKDDIKVSDNIMKIMLRLWREIFKKELNRFFLF